MNSKFGEGERFSQNIASVPLAICDVTGTRFFLWTLWKTLKYFFYHYSTLIQSDTIYWTRGQVDSDLWTGRIIFFYRVFFKCSNNHSRRIIVMATSLSSLCHERITITCINEAFYQWGILSMRHFISEAFYRWGILSMRQFFILSLEEVFPWFCICVSGQDLELHCIVLSVSEKVIVDNHVLFNPFWTELLTVTCICSRFPSKSEAVLSTCISTCIMMLLSGLNI